MPNDFYGLATHAVENEFLRVEFLTDAGPRLVRLFLRGSDENWLAELPNKKLATPLGDYFFRGGHRLWYTPEQIPATYQPDNHGVRIELFANGVRLHQPPEPLTGIRKSIALELNAMRAGLTLTHRLENAGTQNIELAPWAITMLPLGGVAILPQTIGAVDEAGLLANRNVVLWAYTRLDDARLELRDAVMRIHARAELPPCKIGYFNRAGKIGYWRGGGLFVKKFAAKPDERHPDLHCNIEVYCNDKFIELETLGPLTRLAPGAAVEHIEHWIFYNDIFNIEQIEELMQ